MLSEICMYLFKHILPPNELKYMLAHWFGKNREEIKEQMKRHGFVVTPKKPRDTYTPGDEIPAWVITELTHRLTKKGFGPGAIEHLLLKAGVEGPEMTRLQETPEAPVADTQAAPDSVDASSEQTEDSPEHNALHMFNKTLGKAI